MKSTLINRELLVKEIVESMKGIFRRGTALDEIDAVDGAGQGVDVLGEVGFDHVEKPSGN
jgi:hypothetical protein